MIHLLCIKKVRQETGKVLYLTITILYNILYSITNKFKINLAQVERIYSMTYNRNKIRKKEEQIAQIFTRTPHTQLKEYIKEENKINNKRAAL